MEAIDKLRQRLKSYSLTYERRFETWCKLLEEIKHLEPELQADLYDEFVEECPFTYSQWNAYAQMWANTGNNEKAYEV